MVSTRPTAQECGRRVLYGLSLTSLQGGQIVVSEWFEFPHIDTYGCPVVSGWRRWWAAALMGALHGVPSLPL